MTKLLNESYALIKAAPLQNAGQKADPSSSSRTEYIPRDPVQDVAEYYRILEKATSSASVSSAPFSFVLSRLDSVARHSGAPDVPMVCGAGTAGISRIATRSKGN